MKNSRGNRILLINPPFPFPYERYLYPQNAIPLGLLVLASALEKKGFDVSILDLATKSFSFKDIHTKCLEYKPHVVGISLNLSYRYEQVKKIAGFIKSFSPKIPIWIGGNHATHLAEEIMQDVSFIDGIVLYLGEMVFPEVCLRIIDSPTDLNNVSGISYRDKNGEIIRNEHYQISKDQFHFFEPAWHLLDLNQYDDKGYIIGSRGCPFNCQFCSSRTFHQSRILYRSIEAIIDEMTFLKKKYGIHFFRFTDDSFTINPKRVLKLCEKIALSNETFEWSCNTRIDLFDHVLFKQMRQAGCRTILFGIESVNNKVLDLLKKNYTEEQAIDTLIDIKSMGISTQLSFVIGLPGDTFQTLKKIKPFVDKTKPSETAFNILKLYPGTEFFNSPEKYGLKILHRNWPYVEHVLPMVETPDMTAEAQLKTYVYLARDASFPKTESVELTFNKSSDEIQYLSLRF